MQLDSVTVELRPRSPWEAAELGFRMVRRDAAAIYRVWFAVTLPMVLLCGLAMWFLPFGFLAPFVYWWLEPLADGPILSIISRRLFGGRASAGDALRAMPAIAWRNRVFWLTPLRLHFARSIAMPITQLENLHGSARRGRAAALNPHIQNYGLGATIVYQHLALSLYFGVMLVAAMLVPSAYSDTVALGWLEFLWTDDGRASAVVSLGLFYVAQTILEPWFVSAGFGLYINCRTHLEAWDVEVAFRRLVAKRGGATVASSLVAISAAALLAAPSADAQVRSSDDFGGAWSDADAAALSEDVAARDELSNTRTVTDWRARNVSEPESPDAPEIPGFLDELLDWLIALGSLLVEFGLWIAVALLLALVFATRDRWLPYLSLSGAAHSGKRRIYVDGVEVTRESLPNDIPGAVMQLWRDGQTRAALAMLYRGSVFHAVDRHGVLLPDSATEEQCMQAVRRQADATLSSYFAKVARTWVRCAYAARLPQESDVSALCDDWLQHYGASP